MQSPILVWDKHRYAFIAVAKSGSTTYKHLMYDVFGCKEDRRESAEKFSSSGQFFAHVPKDYLRVAVIRNPMERAVSMWTGVVGRDHWAAGKLKKRHPGLMFADSFWSFLHQLAKIHDHQRDQHFRSQHWITHRWGRPLYNYILRLEDLGLDKLNSSAGYHFPTQAEQELVRQLFAKDFELYASIDNR